MQNLKVIQNQINQIQEGLRLISPSTHQKEHQIKRALAYLEQAKLAAKGALNG